MAAKRVVVIGGGGHGKVLLDVLSRLPEFEVLGYIDPKDHGPVLGFPRLGGDECAAGLIKKYGKVWAAIGVGKVKAGGKRLELLESLKRAGFDFPAIVAPGASVAKDVVLGEASVVMEGAVVQPGCKLGRAVIINTGAMVDHDCILADDVHVATGAALSGGVSVGKGSLVGAGAACRQGVKISEGVTVGAGAAVVDDCEESGTYVGVPAKRAKT